MTIKNALRFAEQKHRGQTRSGGEPYVNHVIRVALEVARHDVPQMLIAATLLHDVSEDCGVSNDEIKKLFGEQVASWVDELTNKYSDHTPPEEKNAATAAQMARLSMGATLVKLCDRLDNLNDCEGWKPQRIARYCENTEVMLASVHPAWKQDEDIASLIDRLTSCVNHVLLNNSPHNPPSEPK